MQVFIECAMLIKILLLRSFQMFQHIAAIHWCAIDLSLVLEYACSHRYCTVCSDDTMFVEAV